MKLFNLRPLTAVQGKCSLLALTVFLLPACGTQQTASNATPSPSLSPIVAMASPVRSTPMPFNRDAQIESIRQQYAEIKQKLSATRVVKGGLSGFSAEGGSFTAYLDRQTPRLIAATLLGETGRANEEFYFDKEGNLLFVFRREHRYNKPFGKPMHTIEQRFYFHTGKMIRWLNSKNQSVKIEPAEFAEQEERILRFAQNLLGKAGASRK